MGSSSSRPGGQLTAELALHCLHEARGNVPEALEMLRSGPPRRPECHPLADYHYAGLDTWTRLEEQLFKEAFYVHKKNFHLIQKEIQTKTVAQCVEYYYTWKKKVRFGCTRPRLTQKSLKRGRDEMEKAEGEAVSNRKKRPHVMTKENPTPGAHHLQPHSACGSSGDPGTSLCWDFP